jgi:hypothetical protein
VDLRLDVDLGAVVWLPPADSDAYGGSDVARCAHFIICAKRPAASDHVVRRARNPQAKRGRPPAANSVRPALWNPTQSEPDRTQFVEGRG